MCLAQKIMALTAVALLHLGGNPAEPADKVLQAAQADFQSGCHAADDHVQATHYFQDAARGYQKLAAQGYDSAELFLNLGNAHLLADDLPQAIVAYRRGLFRHPLHRELSDNLEAVRDLVGYTQGSTRHRPPADDWPPWMPRPAPDTLVYAVLLLHCLGWFAIGAWLVMRRKSALVVAVVLFVTAGMTGSWWGYLCYRSADDEQQPVIVVAVNGLTLRRGNGTLYARHLTLPIVNRGMEARLIHERGGWLQVQFPGGETGWLPREAVLRSD